MFAEAQACDLPIFASPFDPTVVSFLESHACPIYKIASPEITNHGLIEACAKTGKSVVLSTGLASLEDVNEAVAVLRVHRALYIILKCVSAYPTDSRLLEKSRQHLVKLATDNNIALRQNYNREAPRLAAQVGRYAHAKQYRRMKKSLRTLKTRVGRVHRDVARRVNQLSEALSHERCER